MKDKLKIVYTAIALLFLFSCTERIDIELEEGYTRLVVEGEITTDSMHHVINLSKTSSYFHNQEAPVVSGAMVVISNGTESFELFESTPGTYLTPLMAGEPGKTYELNIELAEAVNGFTHYSALAEMKPLYPVDSINLRFIEKWDFWEVQLFAQEPAGKDYYMFKVMFNNKLVSDSINEVNVSDDRFFSGSYSNGIGVAWLRDDDVGGIIQPGDKITLITSTITESYASFILELQSETGFNNPLFGGPPANVNGNISNGAVGYFAAYGKVYTSTYVTEADQ